MKLSLLKTFIIEPLLIQEKQGSFPPSPQNVSPSPCSKVLSEEKDNM